ncbi:MULTISPECIES: hypothetical protein [Streptomyces]|uniref:EF-hand domain-containing protein n=1 Tax=Streptomyces cinereoruber TaxID=67260 RepID=A0AAV4KFM0_9ACTN|nr:MULTISPECIES: hypothetical protein [Streptomyces]AVH99322.1 hypothetical protein C5L38_33375 [Streptomyces sp. WAC00288]KYG50777.1 hypothetical protein AWI43_33260 [Streptomyces sp. WAC04657]MBB4158730.1 hypothetical protein [Streptomyces cinereoruber]MBY8816471.1 hypothetical protein [Streptomyces cinereoruber]NIH65338.1 hypothetical protein [Streptomyces cinereoruber]
MTTPNDDETVTSITDDVLRDYAWKFNTLLQDFQDPSVMALLSWEKGTGNSKILPGNVKEMVSAEAVQLGFASLAKDLNSALETFRKIAKSANLDLMFVKETFQNAGDDSVDVTEMWEILNNIQRDSTPGTGPSPSTGNQR